MEPPITGHDAVSHNESSIHNLTLAERVLAQLERWPPQMPPDTSAVTAHDH
jgi:hypothetical protein